MILVVALIGLTWIAALSAAGWAIWRYIMGDN